MALFIFFVAFLLSCIGLVVMIGYRMWEFRTGRLGKPDCKDPTLIADDLFKSFFEKGESLSQKGYVYACIQGEKATLGFRKFAIKNSFVERVRTTIDSIRGKNFVDPTKETASTFLRGILEHRNKIRRHKKK